MPRPPPAEVHLRLCFFKYESPLCFDSGEERDDGGEKDVEARTTEGDAENEAAESDVEEEGGGVGEGLLLVDEEDEDKDEEEEKEEAEQDVDDDWEEEGMKGKDGIVGGKLGMEMLHHRHRHHQRASWCKGGGGNEHESSKRLFNLEVFLEAYSLGIWIACPQNVDVFGGGQGLPTRRVGRRSKSALFNPHVDVEVAAHWPLHAKQ